MENQTQENVENALQEAVAVGGKRLSAAKRLQQFARQQFSEKNTPCKRGGKSQKRKQKQQQHNKSKRKQGGKSRNTKRKQQKHNKSSKNKRKQNKH